MFPLLLAVLGAGEEPAFAAEFRKTGDALVVRAGEKRTVLVVRSATGIGSATVTPTAGKWPANVAVRFEHADGTGFQYLEHFTLETPRVRVSAAERESGKAPFAFVGADGKPGDPAGEMKLLVEKKGGSIEVTLPAHLLAGTEPLKLDWIDAYR